MKQLFILLMININLSVISQTLDSVQVTLQRTYTTVAKYGIDDPFYIVTDNLKKGVYNKDGKMIVFPGIIKMYRGYKQVMIANLNSNHRNFKPCQN